MQKPKPIRRANELAPWSRDHHHALLFCWKIKTGLTKKVNPQRISRYVRWFYENHLLPHFQTEEQYIFPVLAASHPQRIGAEKQHAHIYTLFAQNEMDESTLRDLEESLSRHIRFEERELFNTIQASATAEQLASIIRHHEQGIFCENETDPFWK